jgi:two-component system response regulator CpxR
MVNGEHGPTRNESGGGGGLNLSCKVLLVDDERDYVETLTERLQLRQVDATAVHNGEQALAAIDSDAPQIVVLDLRMPGLDGFEVLQRIKELYPDIQVIILTGHGSDQDSAKCMELGAFAFLQKPVDLEELAGVMFRAQQG